MNSEQKRSLQLLILLQQHGYGPVREDSDAVIFRNNLNVTEVHVSRENGRVLRLFRQGQECPGVELEQFLQSMETPN